MKRNSGYLPFPLNNEKCRYYSKARHAIWNACKALGLKENDVILVPAYHHGSEIEAILQAGLKIRYFEINASLEPDKENLETLLSPDVKALYIIHYLGFPQNAAYWREWCDEKGIFLMEDAAQGFLSFRDNRPIGSFGHLGLFCLYKTYGIPDGSALISIAPPEKLQSRVPLGIWGAFKRHFNWIAERFGLLGFIHQLLSPIISRWKKKTERQHQEFELGDPLTPATVLTSKLLPHLLDKNTAVKRREHYQYLLKHLGEMAPKPFAALPEGASPFAFPIEVSGAKEFLIRLRKSGVVGLLFWINPHPSLPVADFPRSRALRERVLALPVHQELTLKELQQIVIAVKKCLSIKTVTISPSKPYQKSVGK